MRYRRFGQSEIEVSEIGFGVSTLASDWWGRVDDKQGMLHAALDAGINFIDTAPVYGEGGIGETLLAEILKTQRDELVLTTKCGYDIDAERQWGGKQSERPQDWKPSAIRRQLEASLRRLGTDYIDLYQVHSWDHHTPLEETLSTLNDPVRSGKVRYLGASNYSGWQLQKAIDLSRRMGWEPFTCLQPQYNLLCRSTEWELLPVCANEGLGVIPWSPLRGGWLSGKYRRGMTAPPPGTRVEIRARIARLRVRRAAREQQGQKER